MSHSSLPWTRSLPDIVATQSALRTPTNRKRRCEVTNDGSLEEVAVRRVAFKVNVDSGASLSPPALFTVAPPSSPLEAREIAGEARFPLLPPQFVCIDVGEGSMSLPDDTAAAATAPITATATITTHPPAPVTTPPPPATATADDPSSLHDYDWGLVCATVSGVSGVSPDELTTMHAEWMAVDETTGQSPHHLSSVGQLFWAMSRADSMSPAYHNSHSWLPSTVWTNMCKPYELQLSTYMITEEERTQMRHAWESANIFFSPMSEQDLWIRHYIARKFGRSTCNLRNTSSPKQDDPDDSDNDNDNDIDSNKENVDPSNLLK